MKRTPYLNYSGRLVHVPSDPRYDLRNTVAIAAFLFALGCVAGHGCGL